MSLSIEGKDTELRARLVIEGETVSGHCDRIRALKAEFSHTIRCIARPADGTCVTHAFGLLEEFRLLVAELESLGVKPGSAFITWLLEEGRLVEIDGVRPNALALYFEEGSWKHAGVVSGEDRIVSKWGTYGVFDHRLSQVPGNYGNEVRFFDLPNLAAAADLFFEFACGELDLKPEEIDRLREATGMSAPL